MTLERNTATASWGCNCGSMLRTCRGHPSPRFARGCHDVPEGQRWLRLVNCRRSEPIDHDAAVLGWHNLALGLAHRGRVL